MTIQRITLAGYGARVEEIPRMTERAVLRALRSTAMRAVSIVIYEIDHADPHPAVSNGQMRQSTGYSELPNGAEVHVDAPQAVWMEEGTRAHFPPLEPLIAWVIRKGFADNEREARRIAYRVARAISRRGIQPRHFFAKAMARVQREILPAELERAREELP